jgi:hypothetical protein
MTTSQTYQTDTGQLVHAHDQVISDDNLIKPEASPAVPDLDQAEPDADPIAPDAELADQTEPDTELADQTEPDTELAEPDTELAEPDTELAEPDTELADQTEPDAEQTVHEDLTSHPAGAVALADTEPATSAVSGYPDFSPDGDRDGVAEPEMTDSSPGSPSLVSVDFTVPESVTESHPSGDAARATGPWNEIQAMFVDDPHVSIERAAGLVDDRVEDLIQSVRDRQHSMRSAWQADDAGTEELRVALQHYRSFWNDLEDLPARG